MSDKLDGQSKGVKKAEMAALPGDPGGSLEGARRICSDCGKKPTISDSCPYCPSCMNKRGRKTQTAKNAPVRARSKERTANAEKTPPGQNLAVSIDFEKHPLILKQVRALADQEIRPLDLQIIFLLKRHFDQEAVSK